MVNKPKRNYAEEMTNINEMRNLVKQEMQVEIDKLKADIDAAKDDYHAIGAIQNMELDIEFKKLLKQLIIYKILKQKDYRKAGMTKEQFLDAIGEEYKTTQRIQQDIAPLYEQFSDKMSNFLGMKFNEIRYLGKSISDNLSKIKGDVIEYKGQQVPLSEVKTIMEDIHEEMKKLREENSAAIKAKDRLLRDKDKHAEKLQKELSKFERNAHDKGLTLDEDAFLQQMENLRIGFEGHMLTVDPDRPPVKSSLGENPSKVQTKAYITVLRYMMTRTRAAHDTAVEMYGGPEDDDYEFPSAKDK